MTNPYRPEDRDNVLNEWINEAYEKGLSGRDVEDYLKMKTDEAYRQKMRDVPLPPGEKI